MTLIQLYLCLNAIEDYTEDIAMFANSWLVLTPDDTKCVPTPSDFPNPCSSGMPCIQHKIFGTHYIQCGFLKRRYYVRW